MTAITRLKLQILAWSAAGRTAAPTYKTVGKNVKTSWHCGCETTTPAVQRRTLTEIGLSANPQGLQAVSLRTPSCFRQAFHRSEKDNVYCSYARHSKMLLWRESAASQFGQFVDLEASNFEIISLVRCPPCADSRTAPLCVGDGCARDDFIAAVSTSDMLNPGRSDSRSLQT